MLLCLTITFPLSFSNTCSLLSAIQDSSSIAVPREVLWCMTHNELRNSICVICYLILLCFDTSHFHLTATKYDKCNDGSKLQSKAQHILHQGVPVQGTATLYISIMFWCYVKNGHSQYFGFLSKNVHWL